MAAQGLRYRDFIAVALVVEGENPFPDNWIYIHEPDVKVGPGAEFQELERGDDRPGRHDLPGP